MEQKTFLKGSLKDGKIVRWLDKMMPLKFYIAPFRWYKAKNEDLRYREMVIRALQIWEQATNNKVRFVVTDEKMNSHINLEWQRIDRKALGYCQFSSNNSILYTAEVQIGLSDGIICQRYQDENEVFHTILHEIGHSIGLGHSPYKSDIMYSPHQYGVINLSQNDKETADILYSLPCGISCKEIADSYNLQIKDIDELFFSLKKRMSKNKKNVINTSDNKDLLKETENLAEIKKYNIQLQNVRISDDVINYLKKTRHKKIDKT